MGSSYRALPRLEDDGAAPGRAGSGRRRRGGPLRQQDKAGTPRARRSPLLRLAGAAAAGSLVLVLAPGGRAVAHAQEPAATLPRAQRNLSLAWAIPASPVGRQLRWLLAAAGKPPIPAAAIRAHFDARFLAAVPPASLNAGLAMLRLRPPLRVTFLGAGLTASALEGGLASGAGESSFVISVDAAGLISGLRAAPAPALPAAPGSWAGLDAQLRSLAPDVGFLAATLSTASTPRDRAGAACHVLDSLSPATARPLASIFKLYVLSTVAGEVRSGRLSLARKVALTAALRSLPSGFLQIVPVGTRYTVGQLAQIMIPGSDNTAADRLIALAGRSAVESQVATTSAHPALDEPFLSTRELFVLKYTDFPKYAGAYLRLPPARRPAYLHDVVDRVPLSEVDLLAAATGAPRDIGSIEWFASPSDVCALYAQLYSYAEAPSLAPIAAALSYNDAGIGLPAPAWPLVWYKGGSEQGVLTLGFLARRADGTVAVVAVMLSDPGRALGPGVALKAIADARAAFGLVPAG